MDWLKEVLDGRQLDYLVVHHMELDHSSEIGELIRQFPDVKIVGNAKTFKVLSAYFGCSDNFVEVKDGDTLDLGHHKLKFVFTPWVPWPETMVSYDMTDGVLFSGRCVRYVRGTRRRPLRRSGRLCDVRGGDASVLFEYRRKYSSMVQKALARLSTIEVRTICPLHGLVWRSDPSRVIGLYDRWSRYEAEAGAVVIYASMYGNTARMADYIATGLADNGVKSIRVHDASKTHISYLINDIWRYRGVVLGSCAYNLQMFPLMENLTRELLHMGVKNKLLGLFGTFSWNGGGVKNLKVFAEEIGWEQVAPAVEIQGRTAADKLVACDALAEAMAGRLLGKEICGEK